MYELFVVRWKARTFFILLRHRYSGHSCYADEVGLTLCMLDVPSCALHKRKFNYNWEINGFIVRSVLREHKFYLFLPAIQTKSIDALLFEKYTQLILSYYKEKLAITFPTCE